MICRGETLNLPHYDEASLTAPPGPISRSWSFCADGVGAAHDPKKLQDFLDKDHVPSKDEHWQ